jgi:pimeloyl-ACP methyl ester carboxylesterase
MALLGWSGLGMEMAVYTLRYPDRVTRLIQMSPVPPAASIMRESGDARTEMGDQTALEALDSRGDAGEFDETPEEYCRLRNALTDPTNFVDTELAKKVPDVCVHENEWPKNLWPYFGALLPSFGDYDWRDDLQDLKIPRLVIHGREDGIPLSGAEAWVAGYPEARLLVLSPSGHFPYIEQKEAVLTAINTFLGGEWPQDAVAVSN